MSACAANDKTPSFYSRSKADWIADYLRAGETMGWTYRVEIVAGYSSPPRYCIAAYDETGKSASASG